jgi:hypothetical protein
VPAYEKWDDALAEASELRIEAVRANVEGDPLAYVAVYLTDPAGQWLLWRDFDFGPFDPPNVRAEALAQVRRAVSKLLA